MHEAEEETLVKEERILIEKKEALSQEEDS